MPLLDGPVRRALILVGVVIVGGAVIGAGMPVAAPAASAAVAAEASPAPTEPPATEPVDPETQPGEPAPSPSETAPPVEPTPAEPHPATPTPEPTTPAPGTPSLDLDGSPVAPALPGAAALDPWAVSSPQSVAPAGGAIAAPAFGVAYPTNPWNYNALPGTRFLDARGGVGRAPARSHMGIDAQGGLRQPIFAVADGIVVDGTWGTTSADRHGYGNQVVLTHADGFATRYAHLAEAPLVVRGDRVAAGQLIGYMGGSQRGNLRALPRHLHFEVTWNGRHVDPIAFLTGASTVAPGGTLVPAPTDGAATAPAADMVLSEIRPGPDDSWVSISTGVEVASDVFTAVATGGASATILVSEGGRLWRIEVVDGTWTKTDTGLALTATSMSGVEDANGDVRLLAMEDGKLTYIAEGSEGWTKTWTGHHFSGAVSAVQMPEGDVHGMLQQAGYLYHLSPAAGGLWNIEDTRLEVGEQFDAAYVDGPAPEAMTIRDGEILRIVWDGVAWSTVPTGLPAAGTLAAAYPGGGWPVAMTAESEGLAVARVERRTWSRFVYDVSVPGAIDAVSLPGGGTLLYAVG